MNVSVFQAIILLLMIVMSVLVTVNFVECRELQYAIRVMMVIWPFEEPQQKWPAMDSRSRAILVLMMISHFCRLNLASLGLAPIASVHLIVPRTLVMIG